MSLLKLSDSLNQQNLKIAVHQETQQENRYLSKIED